MVAIEAETAAENSANAYVQGIANGHTWSLVDGQSTKAMLFGPDDGTSVTTGTDAASLAAGSRLNYKINFPTTGSYNVWLLTKSHSFQTDSIHVGLDNQYKFTSNGIQNVSNSQFRWVNLSNGGTLVTGGTTLNISAGEHELNLWGRESGLIIDRIYLTTSNSTADPVWPTVEPKEVTAAITADNSVKPGSSFIAAVNLNNLTQTAYAQDITLSYDPNVFDYVSAVGSNENIMIAGEDKTTTGKVRLIAANIGGITGASTPILNLTFKVKSGVHDTTGVIAVTQANLADPNGTVVQAALSSKSISIGSVEIVVDKSALTTAITNAQSVFDSAVVGTQPGQYSQGAKDALGVAILAAKAVNENASATQPQVDSAVAALGSAVDIFKAAVIKSADMNNDGSINVGDLAMVAYHYGKDSTSADWTTAKAADLNGDNKIDILDLAIVASKILE
ncbi:cohesin domain-containing protein [Paenibacillus chondroitinus]|uniref:Cohesin domain-containing protein n=2 Tax=Paenibacillus TaxID=44249 RepID=A0ABU6DDY1_9BACL|nr:cohesin domain-containing protein [Paenibacillus anseongense]MCY9659880.1 cohesin domain-containing protein [Paenibacillus anseongense]MEB4795502.1 cohesin domain-containing protein [Paenibacillus chondroitinus]